MPRVRLTSWESHTPSNFRADSNNVLRCRALEQPSILLADEPTDLDSTGADHAHFQALNDEGMSIFDYA
jgi:ABC-type ATPase involved in cell division